MTRILLALLLVLSSPLWAGEARELTWAEMIPEGAPPPAPV